MQVDGREKEDRAMREMEGGEKMDEGVGEATILHAFSSSAYLECIPMYTVQTSYKVLNIFREISQRNAGLLYLTPHTSTTAIQSSSHLVSLTLMFIERTDLLLSDLLVKIARI